MNNYVFVVDGFIAPFVLVNKMHIMYKDFFIKSKNLQNKNKVQFNFKTQNRTYHGKNKIT